jgi:lactate permease
VYHQNYNPMGNVLLSTLVAAIPILTLLYFIALHPHRDGKGVRHLGISAPYAAFFGVIAAFVVSCFAFGMPFGTAFSAFVYGSLGGFLGIIWIILGAMFLYTMTVITGKFEIVKESIIHISSDRRLQVLLIAFSFGAIIEGTSGFGTPVAIAGAVMVGLGFSPFQAAVLNLLANTAPVAWGAIGTPIVTLGQVSGIDALVLSEMAGRQLPFVSVLVPFWLICTFVFMEGGKWSDAWEVWPATLVSGGSFAFMQWNASSSPITYLMTDVVSGVFSVICTAIFLRFIWKPKTAFLLKSERAADAAQRAGIKPIKGGSGAALGHSADWKYPYTVAETVSAWIPWAILIFCCGLWGYLDWKAFLNSSMAGIQVKTEFLGGALTGPLSAPVWSMPLLDGLVQRVPPVLPAGAKAEAAKLSLNYLSLAGTGVFTAAILTGFYLRLSPAQWSEATGRTLRRLKIPVLVIGQVLGLAALTRYAGTDAVIGLAFTGAGVFYPFFAAYLGWLGVFLTGSDTASNALFGSLQRITAQQLGLNEVLIVATNSTGGVMGKMIDAQSIMVAAAACYEDEYERSHSLGPIFRKVFWHSVALAAVMGIIVMLQAYVFPGMIPALPLPK